MDIFFVQELLFSSSDSSSEGDIIETRGPIVRRPRIENYIESTVDRYSEEDFKKNFRMNRTSFNHVLTLIQGIIQTDQNYIGHHTISAKTQLLLALWYFATPDSYRSICSRFNIGPATGLRSVRRIANALLDISPNIIKWPMGEQQIHEVCEGFQAKGFPNTVGAIDGCHIQIPKPKQHGLSYINRKNQSSIVLQRTEYTETKKLFNSYLGIPYAAPPVEQYRFAPPQKHSRWNGTYQATKFPPRCVQLPTKTNDSEDCLYLNIWTPVNSRSPLPVVIFLEGVDFFRSSELSFSGQDLATEGVVVVSVNYRLNIFGFFCLGSTESRGNMGLIDQYFAILWTRDNIQHFGGDKEKITLFGHSSGAISVYLHLVSPRTAGLFQRAIMISGSAVSPWQIHNDPTVPSKQILGMLGCNLYTVDPMACIKSKKTEDLLQALQEYSESYQWTDQFLPVKDTFLPESDRYLPYGALKAFRETTFYQVPILTGISKPVTFSQLDEWYEVASQGFVYLQQYMERAKIPEILRLYKFSNITYRDQIFDIIKWKYRSYQQGDVRQLIDKIKSLEFEAKLEAPHFLQLSYLGSYVQPIYAFYLDDIGLTSNTTDNLATTDLLLLFGPSLIRLVGRGRFIESEAKLSFQIKQMFTNFIMFGNPTPNNHRINQWHKFTSDNKYVEDFGVHLSARSKKEVQDPLETSSFWNTLLPSVARYRNNISNNIPNELRNSPDPAAGFRLAMYTLTGLVIALLALLVVCIILLKRKTRHSDREFHLGF